MSVHRPFNSWRTLLLACAAAAGVPVAIALLGGSPGPAGTTALTEELELRYLAGDSMHWRLPGYDDRHWIRSGQRVDRDATGRWIRFEVPSPPPSVTEADTTALADGAVGLSLVTTFAYDLYWNGQRIGSNVPREASISRTRADIRVGEARASTLHRVPSSAVRETNLVALRVRVSPRGPVLILDVGVGDYQTMLVAPYQDLQAQLFVAGAYVVLAIVFALLMMAGSRGPSQVIFLTMLVLAAILTALLYWTGTAQSLSVTGYQVAVAATVLVSVALGLLTPMLFAVEVGFRRKWLLVGVFAVGIGVGFPLLGGPLPFLVGAALATIVTVWGLRRGVRESQLAAVGLSALIAALVVEVASGVGVTDLGYLLMLLAMNVSLVEQARQRRRALHESQVRSARLESELLKRIIQPHYLLNSLNAMADWLEEEPEEAGRLLGALTDEFQLIGSVSDQPLIPLDDEIRICRAHLTIMGYRQDRAYDLELEGVRPGLSIPPGVFHTLTENGITHGGDVAPLAFRLVCTEVDTGVEYRFWCGPAAGGPVAAGGSGGRDGTGLRYIRARLQEAYGDRWSLEGGPQRGGWETVIGVPA